MMAYVSRSALLALLVVQSAASRLEVAATAASALRMMEAMTQDSLCSDGPLVTKDTCLGKAEKCMFLELDKRNLCLPCEWGGAPIPCVPYGAAYPQGTVQSCDMTCAHQQVVTKVSDCTDVSGDINQADCYAKGTSAGIQCIWTEYLKKDGSKRTMCGPCKIDGLGTVERYLPGTWGPEQGSIVQGSSSMCEDAEKAKSAPCAPPLNCPTPQPELPPKEGQTPAIASLPRMGMGTTPDAPAYFAAPISPPYGPEQYAAAAEVAATAAGWTDTAKLKEVKNIVLAAPIPQEGPTVPPEIMTKQGRPLPGLLFPVPHYSNPGVLAEHGHSFTPQVMWDQMAPALLAKDTRRKLRGQ